jgi:hypothetical protein
MKKTMSFKGRLLAFMMKFSMGNCFFVLGLWSVLNSILQWLVATWRVYNESRPYHWCFDSTKWMISLKSARSCNCRSQGQKNWVYGDCLAFNSFSSLIPLRRFAPCDLHAILSPIDN